MPIPSCHARVFPENVYSMESPFRVPFATYLNIKQEYYAPENDWKSDSKEYEHAQSKMQKQQDNVYLSRQFLQLISKDDVNGIDALCIGGRVDLQQTCTTNALFALYIASSKGLVKTTKYLLDHGVDINQQTADGYTALHAACQRNQLDIVRMLLQNKANVNAEGPQNVRAIHFAAQYGHYAIVDMLISNNADHLAKSGEQNLTSLMLASQLGHVSVIKSLLSVKDSGLFIEDSHGNTALHYAAREGQSRAVLLLITAGANALELNEEQDTAIDLAVYHKHTQVAKLLEMSLKTVQGRNCHAITVPNNRQLQLERVLLKNRQKYVRFCTLKSIQE